MNKIDLDYKSEKHFSRRYLKLIQESADFIVETVDKIKPLPDAVEFFQIINDRGALQLILDSYNPETDDGLGVQIITLATIIKEITKRSKIEVEFNNALRIYKFFENDDGSYGCKTITPRKKKIE